MEDDGSRKMMPVAPAFLLTIHEWLLNKRNGLDVPGDVGQYLMRIRSVDVPIH
jgi:hypothetical protein